MNKPLVYLAGPISITSYEEATDWRSLVAECLAPDIACLDPMRGKSYLRGEEAIKNSYPEYYLSRAEGIVARDRMDVMRCDLVLMNLLDAPKVSIGCMIEVGWADAYRKPIILVIEDENNPHHHGMVLTISPFHVDNLVTAIGLVKDILLL